jgi:site-specific DNA recombinase
MNLKQKKSMSLNNKPQKAVIYCRVSSQQQVTQGSGLESQETRCKNYAASKNYEVAAVFKEEGISGCQ